MRRVCSRHYFALGAGRRHSGLDPSLCGDDACASLRRAEAPQWAVEKEEAWLRREVALSVVPAASARERSLGGLQSLLSTLLEEEKSALAEALQAATDGCAASAPTDGWIHWLPLDANAKTGMPMVSSKHGGSLLLNSSRVHSWQQCPRLPLHDEPCELAGKRWSERWGAAALRRRGRVDPLTVLHHAGLFQQHLCRLMETVRAAILTMHARRELPSSLRSMRGSHACKVAVTSHPPAANSEPGRLLDKHQGAGAVALTSHVDGQVVGPTLGMLRARSAQQDVQLAQLRGIREALREAERERRSRPAGAPANLGPFLGAYFVRSSGQGGTVVLCQGHNQLTLMTLG